MSEPSASNPSPALQNHSDAPEESENLDFDRAKEDFLQSLPSTDSRAQTGLLNLQNPTQENPLPRTDAQNLTAEETLTEEALTEENFSEETLTAEQENPTVNAPPKAETAQAPSAAHRFSPRKGVRYKTYLFFKRAFDIFASGLFLLLFCWLYLILALVVKCSDRGSVFYKHKRVGKDGKTIYLPKFRSMVKNADQVELVLTEEQLKQYREEYKIDNDPRITKVGKFLRKTSLDELPNIFSIFIGDLSVIGPRPLMESEIDEKYGEDKQKLLSVKPGMIGWWAANGRSNCTYQSGERQKLELYYVDHCSVGLDLKIIFKTIGAVFRREGAK